jgi:hypothetical protein
VLDREPESNVLRTGEPVDVLDKLAELRELKFDRLEDFQHLLMQYKDTNVPRENGDSFINQLVFRHDSYFVEAGDEGLIYLTDVRPFGTATLNVVFWDRKLSPYRTTQVRAVLKHAFAAFQLLRINAVLLDTENRASSSALRRFLMRVGFKPEGLVRHAQVVDNRPVNMTLLGLIADEASPWQLPTISSDKVL